MYKRRAIVIQDHAKDCGVACLLSMIRRYGGNQSIDYLRKLTNTGKEGTTAYRLVSAAKEIGFDAEAYRLLKVSDVMPPFIAHVIINQHYHHFVIVESYTKNSVVLFDPAYGFKKYTLNDFESIWTRVAIVLKPKKRLAKEKQENMVFSLIIKHLKKYKGRLVAISILSIFFVLSSMIGTYYFKVLFNMIESRRPLLWNVVLLFVFVSFLKSVLGYYRNQVYIFFSKCMDQTLFERVFDHIIKLPYEYYSTRYTGDSMERMNNLIYIRDFLNKISYTIIVDLFIGLIALILLVQFHFSLLLVLIGSVILYLLISYQYYYRNHRLVYERMQHASTLSHLFVENLSNMELIKGLHVEKMIVDKTNRHYASYLDLNAQYQQTSNRMNGLKNMLIDLSSILTLTLGSMLVWNHDMTFGDLLFFYSVSLFFVESVRNIVDLQSEWHFALDSVRRINELLQMPSESFATCQTIVKGNIKMEQISFRYQDKDLILSGFNMVIHRGEKVLIKGSSGVGKSTLLKLIMRYMDVSSGKIYIDGKPIQQYALEEIRSMIGYVSQNNSLFTDTLYNNLVLGKDVSTDFFSRVCTLLKIDEIVRNRNSDYQMMIEENGSNLSGGEQQRIFLAQALFQGKEIYLLDESLSEMDPIMEVEITKSLFELLKDKTVITVSHSTYIDSLYNKHFILKKGEEHDSIK